MGNHPHKNNSNWKGGVTFHQCIVCDTPFRGARKSKYCSWNCYLKDIKKNIIKKCLNCGKKFEVILKGYYKNRKYCSINCAYESPLRNPKIRTILNCNVCGTEFNVPKHKEYTAKYCGLECKHIGQGKTLEGRVFSKEHREKIGLANTGRPNLFLLKANKDPEFIKKRLKSLMKRPTKPELKLIQILDNNFPNEFKYVGDGEVILAGLNPDFINCNGKKIIIEVFGDYWHNFKSMPHTSKEKTRKIIYGSLGFRTLVIWEKELNTLSEIEITNKVKEFIEVAT